jgi:hypothetical protein
MNRSVVAFVVVVLTWALVSCAGEQADSPAEPRPLTESLPLQESGLAVGGDVEAHSTKLLEAKITQAQLERFEDACRDAQGIPLEGSDSCPLVQEIPAPQPCGPIDICVEIFAVNDAGFAPAGYVQVTDRRETGSQCESDPEAVCLRVGVTAQVLEELTETTPTATTSTATTPTATTPTATTPTATTPTETTPIQTETTETETTATGTTAPTAAATTARPSALTATPTP